MRYLKSVLMTLAAAMAALTLAKPVPELAKFEYLVGEWHGQFGPLKGVMVNDWVEGGRFLRTTTKLSGPDGSFTETSYLGWDAKKKQYVAWNFNAMAALPRVETGSLDGDALVLVSEPWESGPMNSVSRGTSRRVSDTEITVKVEVQQGDLWLPMYDGKFNKVVVRAGKARIVSKSSPPPQP